jgi:hypothetical protein
MLVQSPFNHRSIIVQSPFNHRSITVQSKWGTPSHQSIDQTFKRAREIGDLCPILAIVNGTTPDFYKQAPLVSECASQNIPALVTGQHYLCMF